jgi:hypothetical protein
MSTLREAAQQALEALESEHPDIQLRAAIILRDALAKPDDCDDDFCINYEAIEELSELARRHAAQRAIAALTEDKPDGCDYDDCINYEENELCYRWSSGECTGPRMPK